MVDLNLERYAKKRCSNGDYISPLLKVFLELNPVL